MRARAAALAAATALAACGEDAPRVDCSAHGITQVLDDSARSPRDQRMLFGDEAGYALFWGSGLENTHPAETGVFAIRQGASSTRLVQGVNAVTLAVAPVQDGYLICWTDTSSSSASYGDGSCLVVNLGLHIVRPTTRPTYGPIVSLGRIDGVLHAIQLDTYSLVLVPITETGERDGTAVPAPCTFPIGSDEGAWTPGGIACLEWPAPPCGTIDATPDCGFGLRVFGAHGELRLEVPDVAPVGTSFPNIEPRIAGGDDGFLISWVDGETLSEWHARHISPTGEPGPIVDVPRTSLVHLSQTITAVPGGYIALWNEGPVPAPAEYVLPYALLLDSAGEPLAQPAPLIDPGGAFHSHAANMAAVGSSPDGGFGVVWEATDALYTDDVTHSALFFRDMSCPLPYAGGE